MADRDFKGVWIPKEIWLDERLNALEKVILVEIDSLDSTDAHCWKSNENLAEFCQCSATKVSNAISKLIKLGYVKVNSFDGRKRRLQSCLTFSVGEPYKNCKADLQNLQASNTYSNPLSNPDRNKDDDEKSAGTCEEVNPYGGDRIRGTGEATSSDPAARGHLPLNRGNAAGEGFGGTGETVQKYALDNLRVMTPGHMQEFNEFMTVHGVSEDLMKYAVDVACGNGAPVWNYVAQVLYGWLDAGVKSVGDAKAEQAKRKKKRDGPKQSRAAIDRENNKVPLPYGGGIIV